MLLLMFGQTGLPQRHLPQLQFLATQWNILLLQVVAVLVLLVSLTEQVAVAELQLPLRH
jgi:hypothetical protein